MEAATAHPAIRMKGIFEAVPWLPAFKLRKQTVLREMEIYIGPGVFPAFLGVEWRGYNYVVSDDENLNRLTAVATVGEIRAIAARLSPTGIELSELPAKWRVRSALILKSINKSLRAFPNLESLIQAAWDMRARYLWQIDSGRLPAASRLRSASLKVPNAFVDLGKVLPTKEAIALLSRGAQVVEYGAGFGLVARALEQAKVKVLATDKAAMDDPRGIGFAFPVIPGIDAAIVPRLDAISLIIWPDVYTDWYLKVFLRARPGDLIAFSSPELDALETQPERYSPDFREKWCALYELKDRLAREFDLLGQVPLVPAGPGSEFTMLRLWKRK